MRVLVVGEHDGRAMRSISRSALQFARSVAGSADDSIECLILGADTDAVIQDAAQFSSVLSANSAALADPLSDRYAHVIVEVVTTRNVDLVVAASSTFAKDVVSRAAGLLGGVMASDVVGHDVVDGELHLQRPMYAGAVLATVALHGHPQVVTVRASSYPAVEAATEAFDVENIPVNEEALPNRMHFEGLASKANHRPDVTEAQVVVSGGRGIKNSEDFEQLVGGLADCLQGATGSSRALVDAGVTPNDMQVGQTGKIVAPEIYVALGLSGAVQHLAGMKNSKKIVAVNKDPDAPIFQFADYGLIGDVYEIVPKLISLLSSRTS